MNKILKTARIVRGITPQELAGQLGLTLTDYLELENQVKPMTPDLCRLLAGYFDLPTYYFKPEPPGFRKRAILLKQELARINSGKEDSTDTEASETSSVAADPHLEILDLREQLTESIARQLELTEFLIDLIDLYQHTGKPIPGIRKH